MSSEGNGAIACGSDGCRHIDQHEAEMIWAECQGRARTRAANMPTEQRAISTLFDAWYRLKELGWRDAMYVPRDGTLCEFIECGSTSIHKGHADETGRIWLHADGDLWPSNPVLFRVLPARPCPMTEDRKVTLLRACRDMLRKCQQSQYTLSPMETTVRYDDADCDGLCLLEDIEHELNEGPL